MPRVITDPARQGRLGSVRPSDRSSADVVAAVDRLSEQVINGKQDSEIIL